MTTWHFFVRLTGGTVKTATVRENALQILVGFSKKD